MQASLVTGLFLADSTPLQVVVSGVFSPLDNNGRQEEAVKRLIQRELGPGVKVVSSRDGTTFPLFSLMLSKISSSLVGHMGLLERENASILNASILGFAQRTIQGFQSAMRALDLSCPLFLTQNDGTLTSAGSAARLPIRTFASGPTNSMRGAAFLAGLEERNRTHHTKSIIVIDVGGTTTDVGVLLPSGFPRQAAATIEVGGVRTNFAMADVQSIGLGGGSCVRQSEGAVTVGPDSVGHYLTRDAVLFGGKVLTATDVVVASGRADLGKGKPDVSPDLVSAAMDVMKRKLERIIDKCADIVPMPPLNPLN